MAIEPITTVPLQGDCWRIAHSGAEVTGMVQVTLFNIELGGRSALKRLRPVDARDMAAALTAIADEAERKVRAHTALRGGRHHG